MVALNCQHAGTCRRKGSKEQTHRLSYLCQSCRYVGQQSIVGAQSDLGLCRSTSVCLGLVQAEGIRTVMQPTVPIDAECVSTVK